MERYGMETYEHGVPRAAVVFPRALGFVLLGTVVVALVVAVQHFILWLSLHWDFQPAGAFACIYVAMFTPIAFGLVGRQGWARELLSGIATAFLVVLLLYAFVVFPAAGRLPILIDLLALVLLAVLLWTGLLDRIPSARDILAFLSGAVACLLVVYSILFSALAGIPALPVLLTGAFILRFLVAHHTVRFACAEPVPRWVTKYYTYTICTMVGLSMLFPFLWMVSSSFKRPQEVFTSSSFLPRRHHAAIDGRRLEVTYTNRNRKLEIVPEGALAGSTPHVIFHSIAHVEYPWYLPAKARFYYVSPEDNARRYFRVVRHLASVRVNDPRIQRGDPLHRSRLDVPMRDITTSIALNGANFYGTDKAGEPCGAMRVIPMGRFFFNSLYIAIVATFGTVLTSSLAGYAFARISFPGRDKLFLGYLATLMIPSTVTLIPCFILVRMLGWLDTHAALIVPAMFGSAGSTFLLRQFFMGIPKEIEDAAAIDGCGKLAIYWRIMLPMSMPAMATVTLFSFNGNWSSFLWPLIVLNSPEKMTLPVGLQYFMGLYGADLTLMMAGSLISIVPMIVVFIVGQKYFIKGIRIGAVKG
ncbi:MAG: carbohydrate ABC transporter permease [Planctomycetota bacterium]